ncbi:MAG TPA: DUF1918 domain-containing protein [Candidatus Limnocylindrales bacterium]|jgi:hypothetical protein|nr:DUF1918 domain-containing protein [Candidatus Limnocylindrales bacterium]
MVAKVGDRIIVESEKVGVPTREGEILEITAHDVHTEFRVRWDDGHVSEIRPNDGSYQVTAARATPRP